MVHISRCKKNLPPNHDFVQCDYNALHYVRKHKLAEHYDECSYRQASIASMATWHTEPVAYNEPKVVVDKSVQESTETWEDVSGPSFDPEKRQSEACYMITPAGMTKSERKGFKESERQRLRSRDSSSDSSSHSSGRSQKIKLEQPYDVEPRKPVTGPNKMPGPKIAARFPMASNPPDSQGSLPVGRGRGMLSWNYAE